MEKVGYIDRVSPMMTTGVAEKFAKEWSEVTEELKRRMRINDGRQRSKRKYNDK